MFGREMNAGLGGLHRGVAMALLSFGVAAGCVGCASAKLQGLQKTDVEVVKPDFVLVNDLAVTPKEIELDKGLAAKVINELTDAKQTEEEIKLGRAVATTLTNALVEDLRKAGINAVKASPDVKTTPVTLVITGRFIQVDQGNQTQRVLLGFGIGGGQLRAQFNVSQGGRLIASAQVVTSGSKKPGLLIPIAGGAAAGSYATAAVAGGAAGMSEGFMATVGADAQRAAKVAAKRIVQGYINHGWATPEDLKKLDAIF